MPKTTPKTTPETSLLFPKLLPVIFFTMGVVYSNALYAHAKLMIDSAIPPRYDNASIKTSPPCGSDANFASSRTNRKSIFQTGETITVEWVETVEHGGSYVFDFAPSSEQGFDPNMLAIVPDEQNVRATIPHYYSHNITLNYPACESCIFRMRQDMEDAENYYFSCADIVIVSGADTTPPADVSASSALTTNNSVQLSWVNPADAKAILVLRNNQANSDVPEDRNDYLETDNIGTSVVVYNGLAAEFVDDGLAADTEYVYKIFARDADYNYNAGVTQTAFTSSVPDTGSGGDDTGDETTVGENDDDSGGGALNALLLLMLLRLWVMHGSQRSAMANE